MRKKLKIDDILPGQFQEVLRKIRIFSLWPVHIQQDKLYSFGMTYDELERYKG
jgi:hypothetical protein